MAPEKGVQGECLSLRISKPVDRTLAHHVGRSPLWEYGQAYPLYGAVVIDGEDVKQVELRIRWNLFHDTDQEDWSAAKPLLASVPGGSMER